MSKKTYWAGFSDDALFSTDVDDAYGMVEMPHIYLTREKARKRFADVRKVRIVEIKKSSHPTPDRRVR